MLTRVRPYLEYPPIFSLLNSHSENEEKYIREFEKAFAKLIGSPFCFSTHQGRDALEIILKSIGVSTGDEVLVQNFICHVVIDAIINCGATPVLIDNSLVDFNLSTKDIKRKIGPKTKALIITHMYGVPVDFEKVTAAIKNKSIYIIEDCAHTVLAQYNNKNVGRFGHFAFFSFNFDKPMSTGLGGMLAVNDFSLLENVKQQLARCQICSYKEEKQIVYALLLQHYLTSEENYKDFLPIDFAHELFCINPLIYKKLRSNVSQGKIAPVRHLLNNISSAKIAIKMKRHFSGFFSVKNNIQPKRMNALRSRLGLLQLDSIKKVEERRLDNSNFYKKALMENGGFQTPQILAKQNPSFLRYTILKKSNFYRQSIIATGLANGIELDHNNWTYTISRLYHKNIKMENMELENSELLANSVIHLPTHYYVTKKHLETIANLLAKYSN